MAGPVDYGISAADIAGAFTAPLDQFQKGYGFVKNAQAADLQQQAQQERLAQQQQAQQVRLAQQQQVADAQTAAFEQRALLDKMKQQQILNDAAKKEQLAQEQKDYAQFMMRKYAEQGGPSNKDLVEASEKFPALFEDLKKTYAEMNEKQRNYNVRWGMTQIALLDEGRIKEAVERNNEHKAADLKNDNKEDAAIMDTLNKLIADGDPHSVSAARNMIAAHIVPGMTEQQRLFFSEWDKRPERRSTVAARVMAAQAQQMAAETASEESAAKRAKWEAETKSNAAKWAAEANKLNAEAQSIAGPESDKLSAQAEWYRTRAKGYTQEQANKAAELKIKQRKLELQAAELPKDARMAINKAATDAADSYHRSIAAVQLAEALQTHISDSPGGARTSIAKYVRGVAGAQNKVDALRNEYSRIMNPEVLKRRLPGSASNEDRVFMLKGFPKEDADIGYLHQFLHHMTKILLDEHVNADLQTEWITANKSLRPAAEDQTIAGRRVQRGTTYAQFIRSAAPAIAKERWAELSKRMTGTRSYVTQAGQ